MSDPALPAQETLSHFPQAPSQGRSLTGEWGKEEEKNYFYPSQLPSLHEYPNEKSLLIQSGELVPGIVKAPYTHEESEG